MKDGHCLMKGLRTAKNGGQTPNKRVSERLLKKFDRLQTNIDV